MGGRHHGYSFWGVYLVATVTGLLIHHLLSSLHILFIFVSSLLPKSSSLTQSRQGLLSVPLPEYTDTHSLTHLTHSFTYIQSWPTALVSNPQVQSDQCLGTLRITKNHYFLFSCRCNSALYRSLLPTLHTHTHLPVRVLLSLCFRLFAFLLSFN